MQIYPVELEPEQIVRWIMAESQLAPSEFRTSARSSVETRALPQRKELRLGDEERDDLSEVAAVGTLEIGPANMADGWLLTITVEDEFGPRFFDASTVAGPEREIGVAAFYDSFLRPGRGITTAVAKVRGPESKQRLSRLLKDIETDRHGSSRSG